MPSVGPENPFSKASSGNRPVANITSRKFNPAITGLIRNCLAAKLGAGLVRQSKLFNLPETGTSR